MFMVLDVIVGGLRPKGAQVGRFVSWGFNNSPPKRYPVLIISIIINGNNNMQELYFLMQQK